jgi:hypothetical protein
MDFGIFDQIDRASTPLPDYFEDRLKSVEAYDAPHLGDKTKALLRSARQLHSFGVPRKL